MTAQRQSAALSTLMIIFGLLALVASVAAGASFVTDGKLTFETFADHFFTAALVVAAGIFARRLVTRR